LTQRLSARLAGAAPAASMLLVSHLASAAPTGWTLESTIDGGTTSIGSSIATTGAVAVVGAPFAGTGAKPPGAVYVYSSAAGAWTSTTLLAPTPIAGGNFGSSVAAAGSLVAIGAPGSPPAAYVFADTGGGYVAAHTWTDPPGDENQSFGGSVAVYQGATGTGYVAIAAPPGSSSPTGTVYVSTQTSGGAWSDPPTAITDASAQAFGIAVAFAGNGQLLVGDPGTGPGQVLVYAAGAGGAWTSVGTLPVSLDGGSVQQFGNAIATGGNLAVVTAPGTSDGSGAASGVAFVFAYASGQWTQQAVLAGTSAESFGNFGAAVEGNLLAVGSAIDTASSGTGRVDVWGGSGTSWVSAPSSTLVGDAYYGQAVGLVGTTLFVGDTSALGASSIADVTSSLRIYEATGDDAGTAGSDAGGDDAGNTGSRPSKGGCSCESAPAPAGGAGIALLVEAALALRFVRRRTSSNRPG
jgi:MYXO-CTERM domain-containing protein